MKILYFAWLRERIGVAEEDVTLPDSVRDIAGLIQWLSSRGDGYASAFADLTKIRTAIDQGHVQLDAPLKGAQEVAFFPPVTGG